MKLLRAKLSLFLPIYLVAAVFCGCGTAAQATGRETASQHSCCPRESERGPKTTHHHSQVCLHCEGAKYFASKSIALVAPSVVHYSALPVPGIVVVSLPHRYSSSQRMSSERASPKKQTPLSMSSVLLL